MHGEIRFVVAPTIMDCLSKNVGKQQFRPKDLWSFGYLLRLIDKTNQSPKISGSPSSITASSHTMPKCHLRIPGPQFSSPFFSNEAPSPSPPPSAISPLGGCFISIQTALAFEVFRLGFDRNHFFVPSSSSAGSPVGRGGWRIEVGKPRQSIHELENGKEGV